jgi:hypothetical protein
MSEDEQSIMIKEIPDRITTILPLIHKKALQIKAVEAKGKLSEEKFQMVENEVKGIVDGLYTSHNKLHEILKKGGSAAIHYFIATD